MELTKASISWLSASDYTNHHACIITNVTAQRKICSTYRDPRTDDALAAAAAYNGHLEHRTIYMVGEHVHTMPPFVRCLVGLTKV